MAEPGRAHEEREQVKTKWESKSDTLSAEIRAAAAQIITDSRSSDSSLEARLNGFLRQYLPWPYQVNPARAFDSTGAESFQFGSLIYTGRTATEHVPADNLACAIELHSRLSPEELHRSYDKIARIKSLTKKLPPSVSEYVPTADATMGIIFAVDSDMAIESLAEELARLNREHSYRSWPDMIVVLSRGTVHLGCQIPYKPLGDFLPPARDASLRTAMYIHVVARAHAEFALN